MQPGADEVDYRETADLTRVHGAVKREHREPEAGTVPVPLWLIAVVFLVTSGGAYYLGQYSGGFSGSVFNPLEGQPSAEGQKAGAAAGGEAAAPVETLAQQGKKVFQNCVSCHQADGHGVPSTYPPLAGSEWVLGSPKRVTMVVLKGLQGSLHVEGASFNNAMPAWGSTLTDKKVAAVLSYIRSSWGNNAPEITPEQVAVVRKQIADRTEPFSEADLKDVTGEIEGAAAGAAAPAGDGLDAPRARGHRPGR